MGNYTTEQVKELGTEISKHLAGKNVDLAINALGDVLAFTIAMAAREMVARQGTYDLTPVLCAIADRLFEATYKHYAYIIGQEQEADNIGPTQGSA